MATSSACSLAALLCAALATIAGIIAVGTNEWSVATSSLPGDGEVRYSPFRFGEVVADGGAFDANTEFEDNFNVLEECDDFEELLGNNVTYCDQRRAVAATAILGILLSFFSGIFALFGICSHKRGGGSIVRVFASLAFLCSTTACIVWAAAIHLELRDALDNVIANALGVDITLGYSWGMLIPAAFFNVCTAFAA